MNKDILIEQFFKSIADRKPDKNDETITTFDRNIFWYDRDEVQRQQRAVDQSGTSPVTYETHRAAVEMAYIILHKTTPHDIAMIILTHRAFANYRKNVFSGKGSFNKDYSYLIKKASTLINPHTSQLINSNVRQKLSSFTTPTLVAINHIVGSVEEVTTPSIDLTLQEWAHRYNAGSPESTTYMVAGLKVGI